MSDNPLSDGPLNDEAPRETPLDRGRLRTLLGFWVIAALIPGILTINQPVLLAYVVWGFGFFLGLIVFIAIANMTKTTELWPWLFASVLPWVVNIAVPANPWLIPAFVIAAILFAVWMYRRASAIDRLLHEGIPSTGTVIKVLEPKFAGAAVNNGHIRRSVQVSVARPDKAVAYEAVVRDLFEESELPKPGDTIELRVDPENAMRVVRFEPPAPPAPGETSADEASVEPDRESSEQASDE